MMDEKDHDLPPGLEEAWREWSTTEPDIDEIQLKRNLLAKIPDRMPRTRSRLVLVAAAASLLAVLIGLENSRQPQQPRNTQTHSNHHLRTSAGATELRL